MDGIIDQMAAKVTQFLQNHFQLNVCLCRVGRSWNGCLSWSLSQAALTRVMKLSSVTTGLLDGCQRAKLKTTSTQHLILVFLPLMEWDCLPPWCWEMCVCVSIHGWMCVFLITCTKPLCTNCFTVFPAFLHNVAERERRIQSSTT